ncbi:efflux RND transporter periplasmic adaptor subunit [Phaeocystidibacter marisrubri]|uniref:Efflux RND transporter periplasmic adaptor subunit n=1 Tax=Phaeocystidibacter marisrubri TaxID=1577780 RepID=A0A6L3ZHU3_9FLAO|nr:efflux RND transporter periplasmic adaptor subunit [Phaeocystidibacter marisrubri]KAB2817434.1 efflux RND transporter periplasmic adaptor subunit [Phaeocystidibacter marisrubri]GGH75374.1 RND transporter MFP subunit [Phaeocystidibacter marisrubri]
MKKLTRVGLLLLLLLGVVYTMWYLYDKSQEDPIVYETEAVDFGNIVQKTVATGKVVPREEIDIKPQVSGIIDELFVEPGDHVGKNDLIAKVQVIPDMVSLNNAENRVNVAQLNFDQAKRDFDRQQRLHEQKVVSDQAFQSSQLQFQNAQAELEAAKDNLQIIREGATQKSGSSSLTLIRSTVEGMVLAVPIKKGNQVIESNTFNDGTTVATVADMNDMIFEGFIDESEVGKLSTGMDLVISVGAIQNETFSAKLKYIAPKGTEENGAIQFEIKADVSLDTSQFIRAGYSANADIVLSSRDSVMRLDEKLLQFDGDQPFVEVKVGDQSFERRDVELGLSDGLKVEVLSGLTAEDQIKVWNIR